MASAWHVPVRLATGAYILQSGWRKRNLPEEAAAGIQGFASSAYPALGDLSPDRFARLLSTAEIGLGAALLMPFIPAWLVGWALSILTGGLVGLYLRAPGMRQEGSLLPTEQGNAVAKDVWMLAIGSALVLDSLDDSDRDRNRNGLRRGDARLVRAWRAPGCGPVTERGGRQSRATSKRTSSKSS